MYIDTFEFGDGYGSGFGLGCVDGIDCGNGYGGGFISPSFFSGKTSFSPFKYRI